jgi:hypothetical protein
MAVSGGTALRLLPLDAGTVPEETIEVVVEWLAAAKNPASASSLSSTCPGFTSRAILEWSL